MANLGSFGAAPQGGGRAGVGVDRGEIAALIKNVNNAYSKFYNVFKYQIPTGLMNPIANSWFSPDAVRYTTEFAKAATDVATSIYGSCQSIVNSINSRALKMFTSQGSSWSNVPFSGEPVTVSADRVKEANGDYVGIEPGSGIGTMQAASKNAKALQANIDEAVNAIKAAANASGFYGGGIQNSLIDALAKVTPGYSTSYENLVTAIDKAIEKAIADLEAAAQGSNFEVGSN